MCVVVAANGSQVCARWVPGSVRPGDFSNRLDIQLIGNPTAPPDRLDAALADPTRRALLARLSKGEASVNELAEPFDLTLQAVSKHLKVLEGAGLIVRGKKAQWRPCRLETAPLQAVDGWLEVYRRFWTEGFDKMEAYLETITKGDDDGRRN